MPIPFLAEIGLVDILILALLLGMLVYQLAWIMDHLVVPILRQVPVVGGWVADHVSQLERTVQREIGNAVQFGLAPLTRTLQRFALRSQERSNASLHVFQVVYNALTHLRSVVIPAVQQQAWSWTQQSLAYTNARAAAVAAFASALDQRAVAFTRASFAAAIAHTDQTARQLAASAAAQDRATQEYARQLTQAAVVRADQEIQRAALAAAAEDASVAAYARDLGERVATYAQQLNLETRAKTELGFAQERQELVVTAGALLTQLATMGSGLGNRITKIEQSDCQQQCEPLGQLGKELRALDLLLLIGLVAAMVAKPIESARVTATVLGPVSQEVVSLTNTVLGV